MAYLEITTPEGARRVALTGDLLTLGRLPQCDISLPYLQVSRRHAELRRIDGEWWIADTHSTNGVHLGERRVREHQLAPGDLLLLAPDISLRFIADDSAAIHTPESGQRRTAPPVLFGPDPLNRDPRIPTQMPTLAPRVASPWPWSGPAAPSGQPPTGAPQPPADAAGAPGVRHDPYRRTLPVQPSHPAATILHICQTCGQRTAPELPTCQHCGSLIAAPCPTCGAHLLPIQERCPRCQTPNPLLARRTGA